MSYTPSWILAFDIARDVANTLRILHVLQMKQFWRTYAKNRAAVLGLSIIVVLSLVAALAPLITAHDPWEINFEDKLIPPGSKYPFGTDEFGRDILTRIIYGSRLSLTIGFVAASMAATFGIVIGSLAGYFGGKTDVVLMRSTEMFMVIPTFFLNLLVIAVFGGSIWNVMTVIGLTSWPAPAKLIRSQFLSLRERGFVEAARLVGASDRRIIFRHILPNAIAPIIVSASLQVAGAILTESGLSFLGLGDIHQVTWGQMLYKALDYMRKAWWIAAFHGIAIFVTVLSFNLVGDGLNDVLNPRLKER